MFTQFDTIVAVGTLIFMTLGLFKGAIKSILGLGKWYGAGVLTLVLYPHASELIAKYMQPGMVANGIAVFFTYVAALIILSILIGIFVAALGSTVGGGGDKIMGAIVGATIGLIIASTAHYFIRSFSGGTDPSWLQNGSTYKITSQGADKLQKYFKDVVQNMGSDMGVIKDIDPTGQIAEKIRAFEDSTGSHVDMEKLKEAIRIMKDEGLKPNQIKDLINIQDYMALPQNVSGQATGEANSIVNSAVKQIKAKQNMFAPAPSADDGQ